MAVLDGKLYAVGGHDNDDGYLSSVERYDPALDAWESVASMSTARDFHGVAVLDSKLYAVGGYKTYAVTGGDNNVSHLSSVERYDPGTDAWEAVAPLTLARFGAGVAASKGKLYAVGGYGLSSVERYDPATNAWEAVAPMAAARVKAFAVLM